MNDDLRISIWNVLDLHLWRQEGFLISYGRPAAIYAYSDALWHDVLKLPLDALPSMPEDRLTRIRALFFELEWYEVYDLVEFTLGFFPLQPLIDATNAVLVRELSAYRFVGGVITEISDPEEQKLLEEVIGDDQLSGVAIHLRRSLELLSDRKKPDYRNSIKESISAVESMAKIITQSESATLSDALKILDKSGRIHSALKEGFSKLYGYTSDEGGIRHAMLEEPRIQFADAKYFLISCTAFVNYLKERLGRLPS